MATPTLDQFMADPDPDKIEEMLAAAEGNTPENKEADTPVEPANNPEDTPKDDAVAPPVPAEAPDAPEGVATKDGKGVIPYAVLATERERRHAAEQALQLLQQRLDAQQPAPAGTPPTTAPVAELPSDEDLANIIEDFPAIGKVIQSLQSQVAQANNVVQQVRQSEEQRIAQEQQRQAREVQEAMDNHPTLLYLRDKDPAMFDEAVRLDAQMQGNPRLSHLSLSDRFGRVVEAIETIYGKVELPPEYVKAPAATKADAPSNETDLVTKAKEVVAKVADTAKPRTLSDIPGGTVPVSEVDRVKGMTPAEAASLFKGKSLDETVALLNRLTA